MNTLAQVGSGFALFLGVLLVVAAALKMRDIYRFEAALVRLLPAGLWSRTNSRLVAAAVIAGEVIAGTALLAQPAALASTVALAVAVLFVAFAGLTWRAHARGEACGCFGSPEQPATRHDVARGFTLAIVAITLALLHLVADVSTPITVGYVSVIVALLALSATFGPGIIARRGTLMRARNNAAAVPQATSSLGLTHQTRRDLLKRAAAVVTGLVALGAVPSSAHAECEYLYTRSCQDRHDLCAGCCEVSQSCRDKCIDCYVACQGGGGSPCTPYVDADGCWPPE